MEGRARVRECWLRLASGFGISGGGTFPGAPSLSNENRFVTENREREREKVCVFCVSGSVAVRLWCEAEAKVVPNGAVQGDSVVTCDVGLVIYKIDLLSILIYETAIWSVSSLNCTCKFS